MPTAIAKSEEKKSKSEASPESVQESPQANLVGAIAGVPLFLQTKLMVGPPGDEYEQEADRIANAAVRSGPVPSIQRKCAACASGGTCPKCEEEEKIQRKALSSAPVSSLGGSIQLSGGAPLSSRVRDRVEPILGFDLGHVRVHTDAGASDSALALRAKAFTHQNHIWLGSHENAEDLDLMAHEATHVVQQGAGRAPSHLIQRRESTSDGEAPKARLFGKIEEETGTKITVQKPKRPEQGEAPKEKKAAAKPVKAAETAEMKAARGKVDRGELHQKKSESEGSARPDIDRPAQTRPKVQAAATETKQQVDAPPKPLPVEKDGAGKKGKQKEGAKKPAHPTTPGTAAFDAADSVGQPDQPVPVAVPPPVSPVDAGGQPLPPNPGADAQVGSLAMQAQVLRDEGLRLRQAAAEMRGNAFALRGNLQMVSSAVGESESVTHTFHEHSKFRHEAAGQADQGLAISDQKAATVAKEAPGGVEKASEQKKDSDEVASESSDLAGESASQDADDEEAAAKAQENSGKMNKVSSDIGTIDHAVGQAQSAAVQLVQDAEYAKTTNDQTHTKMGDLHVTLAQTDAKLLQMDGQNAAAREHISRYSSGPDQLLAQAQALDDQGAQLIEASTKIEADLASAQVNYAQAMQSVPKEEESPAEQLVQRQEDAAVPADAGSEIDLNASLPSWLSGEEQLKGDEKEQARQHAFEEHETKRLADIEEIGKASTNGFEKLSAGDKALIALRLTGKNLFGGVSNISWPGWGKVGVGAAHLVVGLFDPRTSLTGALSGVNMIVNASIAFFKQPSWGGLLKLAADIATGITIILGSIVALAGTIAAIMTALSILSFGALAPICGPVIAFCATVMSTVGGWTFWAGAIAFGLQALVFLKDLYAASTAKTASELQKASESMTGDAKNAGNAALQAGMGKLAQFGGRAMQAEIRAAGGGVNFAKQAASKSLLGEAGEGFKGGGGLKGFGKALGKGIGKRAVGAGKAVKQAVTHPIQTIKDIRAAMKAAPKEEPMSFKEGMSKDFLVGPSKEATAASEAKVAAATKAAEDVHPAPKAGVEEPHALEGGNQRPLKPSEEAHLRSTAAKDGAQISPNELAKDKTIADTLPKKEIHEGKFTEKAELPNGHEIKYANEGFCRLSGKPICLPPELEEALPERPTLSKDSPVREGQVREYKETTIKGAGVKGDELTGDHIPSRAALVENAQLSRWAQKEAELGQELTEAQKDALRLTKAERDKINQEGLTIVDREKFHAAHSPTFAGRNNTAQIAQDAKDLGVAASRDFSVKLAAHQLEGTLTRQRVVAYIDLYVRSVDRGLFKYSQEINDLLIKYLNLAK